MLGIILILISTTFGASKDLLSKKIAFVLNGTSSAFLSFALALPWYLLLFLIAYLLDIDLYTYRGEFFLFIVLRAASDSIAEVCKMHALAEGDVSFISNFISLSPIFILFMAPVITGESISWSGVLGVLIIFLGTAILFKMPAAEIPWKGIAYAVLAAFFLSLNICFDRLAATHGDPIFSGFLMTLISAIILLIPNLRAKEKHKAQLVFYPLMFRGLFEVLFMVFKLEGFKYLEPQYAAGIGKFTLVLAVLIGGKVFKEKDQKRRILSAIIISLGSAWIVWLKLS